MRSVSPKSPKNVGWCRDLEAARTTVVKGPEIQRGHSFAKRADGCVLNLLNLLNFSRERPNRSLVFGCDKRGTREVVSACGRCVDIAGGTVHSLHQNLPRLFPLSGSAVRATCRGSSCFQDLP